MILEIHEKEKIINALTKELKHNPSRETKVLLEKLKKIKKPTPVITSPDVKYIKEVTDVFVNTGMFKSIKTDKIDKRELDNVNKLMKKIIELEELKKDFYTLSKEDYSDYEKFKKRIDKFTKDVGEIYLYISSLV